MKIRTLLIHAARAVLTRFKAPREWALRLAEQRPPNVVTVASRGVSGILCFGP